MVLTPIELRDWTIYKITNPTGRIYIGKTYNFKGRISNYRHKAGNAHQQPILYNSLLKYGLDAHKVEVIEQFNSNLSWANGKEIFWIRSEMTNINKWRDREGMNLTDGGEGAPGHKWSQESKDAMSKRQKGKIITPEQIQKVRDFYKDKPYPKSMLGKHHSDEAKAKVSKANKGRKYPKGTRKPPPPVSETTRLKMSLARKGKKSTQLWTPEQRKAVGDSKKGNTYMKGKHLSDAVKKNLSAAHFVHNNKPVFQYSLQNELINEFKGITEACRVTKMSETSIRKILRGVTKNPAFFIFKYQ